MREKRRRNQRKSEGNSKSGKVRFGIGKQILICFLIMVVFIALMLFSSGKKDGKNKKSEKESGGSNET